MRSGVLGQTSGGSDQAVSALRHAEVRAQLSDLLDGTLPVTARRRLERHLAQCNPCTAFARTFAQTVVVVRELPAARLSPMARDRLRHLAATALPVRPTDDARPARLGGWST
jgi:anti-sigma factor RsiW